MNKRPFLWVCLMVVCIMTSTTAFAQEEGVFATSLYAITKGDCWLHGSSMASGDIIDSIPKHQLVRCLALLLHSDDSEYVYVFAVTQEKQMINLSGYIPNSQLILLSTEDGKGLESGRLSVDESFLERIGQEGYGSETLQAFRSAVIPQTHRRVSEDVFLYRSPNPDADILAALKQGDVVLVRMESLSVHDADYAFVSTAQNEFGFIPTSYLEGE